MFTLWTILFWANVFFAVANSVVAIAQNNVLNMFIAVFNAVAAVLAYGHVKEASRNA